MTPFPALALAGLIAAVRLTAPASACAPAGAEPPTQPRLIAPSTREITSRFGMQQHPVLAIVRLHPGIDFPAAIGEPITAAAAGRITLAAFSGEYGNRIEIDHGGGYATTYSHLSRFADGIGVDGCIDAGATIGFVGTTGLVAGPQLHFEVTRHGVWLDPELFLPK